MRDLIISVVKFREAKPGGFHLKVPFAVTRHIYVFVYGLQQTLRSQEHKINRTLVSAADRSSHFTAPKL